MTEPRSDRSTDAAPRRRSSRRAPAEPSPRRWPILVLLPLLIVAAVAVQRHQDDQPATVEAVSPDGFVPTAAAPGSASSTWYCAGGTATGQTTGAAEQTVQIANDSDTALTARVTAFPSQGTSAERDLPVPAHGRVDLAVSSIVTAPYASALVEVDGGEVAVSHLLEGPTGKSEAACSSSPSSSWYIPSGTTRAGTSQVLAVFNPFPSEAVVSVTFEADDGARSPQDFEAVVVAGQSLTVLDIGKTVTLRDQLATTVTVRSGRVIVDQIQSADGTQGTTKSLTVTPGAPKAASTWWFADGPAEEGTGTVFYVQNPSDQTAEVELQIRLDDTATYGQVEPFEVSVSAGRYVAIDIAGDGRVPTGVGYTAVAQTKNGVDIIADRVVSIAAPAPDVGATVTMGSPVLASRWIVPVGSMTVASSVSVVVTNPSSTEPITLTVSTIDDGKVTPLPGMTGVQVLGGGRGGFDVPTGAKEHQVAVDVSGASLVVVEAKIVFTSGGRAAALAVPVAGTNELTDLGIPVTNPADAVTSDSVPTDSVPDDTSLLPSETIPPGTEPSGTNPPGTGG